MTTRLTFVFSALCGVAAISAGEASRRRRIFGSSVLPASGPSSSSVPGSAARSGAEREDPKIIKAGPGATLDLQNISGSITVTGASGDDIVIDAVARPRPGRDAAKALLNAIEVHFVERPSRVTVRNVYPRTTGSVSAAVDYTVRVPFDAAVDPCRCRAIRA
jgi:hypothetical protein